MLNIWDNCELTTWDIELGNFKNHSKFHVELEKAFQQLHQKNSLIYDFGENKNFFSHGICYVAEPIDHLSGFNELLELVFLNIENNLKRISNQKFKKVKKVWANRMFKGAFSSIHRHNPNSKLLILYYNIPENSGDLILVNPKYNKIFNTREWRVFQSSEPNIVPEEDRYAIKVKEGMCVLHDGKVLHGVGKHLSNSPRDVIAFELETLNKE